MSPGSVISAAREMMLVALLVTTPFLAVAMIASLVIGLLQASTRMNDLTLSFVPRFLAVLLAVYLASSWVNGQLAGYIARSIAASPALIR